MGASGHPFFLPSFWSHSQESMCRAKSVMVFRQVVFSKWASSSCISSLSSPQSCYRWAALFHLTSNCKLSGLNGVGGGRPCPSEAYGGLPLLSGCDAGHQRWLRRLAERNPGWRALGCSCSIIGKAQLSTLPVSRLTPSPDFIWSVGCVWGQSRKISLNWFRNPQNF